jgi:hypothetical protein
MRIAYACLVYSRLLSVTVGRKTRRDLPVSGRTFAVRLQDWILVHSRCIAGCCFDRCAAGESGNARHPLRLPMLPQGFCNHILVHDNLLVIARTSKYVVETYFT